MQKRLDEGFEHAWVAGHPGTCEQIREKGQRIAVHVGTSGRSDAKGPQPTYTLTIEPEQESAPVRCGEVIVLGRALAATKHRPGQQPDYAVVRKLSAETDDERLVEVDWKCGGSGDDEGNAPAPGPLKEPIVIKVGEEYTRLPGGRYRNQGPDSGEQLRDEHLMPAFERARREQRPLLVDLNGTEFGYGIGFLEEAFGGLARKVGAHNVLDIVELKCTDAGDTVEDAVDCIEAMRDNTARQELR